MSWTQIPEMHLRCSKYWAAKIEILGSKDRNTGQQRVRESATCPGVSLSPTRDSYGQKTSDCTARQPHNAYNASRTVSREIRHGFWPSHPIAQCPACLTKLLHAFPEPPFFQFVCVVKLQQFCDPPVIQPFAFRLSFCRFYTLL